MGKGKEILETVRRERGYVHVSREILCERDPDYLNLYHRLYVHVMKEKKSLPPKIKEMILVAINAATNYAEGVKVHTRGALEAGAKEEEIFEAIEAASLPAGIHAISFSLPIFAEVCKEYRERKGGPGDPGQ